MSTMTEGTRAEVSRRLKKAAGQVAGLERMVGEDRYCVDVLLQITAVRAALDRIGKILLKGHVETCVATAMKSGSKGQQTEKISELMDVVSRFAHIGGR